METTTGGAADTTTTFVTLPFECRVEIHDRKKFQSDGHMLFQLYQPVVGPEPDIRRPWLGEKVYILSLHHRGAQLYRVMSDSLDDAKRLMQHALRDSCLGELVRQALEEFDRQQFYRLNERHNVLSTYIADAYREEIARGRHDGLGDVFDVALFYLRQERSSFWRRLRQWILHPMRSPAGDAQERKG